MTPATLPPTPDDLDFAAIRQKYPAAFASLIAYARKQPYETIAPMVANAPDSILWHSYNQFAYFPRALYDFFDQQGVYVSVNVSLHRASATFFTRVESEAVRSTQPGYTRTRTDAETAAFTAAFGKLEELLKREKDI